MVRVTSIGGQARIAFLDDDGTRFKQSIERLKQVPWLEVRTQSIKGTVSTFRGVVAVTSTLLVIKKTSQAPKINQ